MRVVTCDDIAVRRRCAPDYVGARRCHDVDAINAVTQIAGSGHVGTDIVSDDRVSATTVNGNPKRIRVVNNKPTNRLPAGTAAERQAGLHACRIDLNDWQPGKTTLCRTVDGDVIRDTKQRRTKRQRLCTATANVEVNVIGTARIVCRQDRFPKRDAGSSWRDDQVADVRCVTV